MKKRTVKGSKLVIKEKFRCVDCRTFKDTKLVPCPYEEEISGTINMVWLCLNCYNRRSWDI